MAAKIFRINYKSDFILTMNSEAGWTIPFCIKFWTSIPMRAYYVGFDGTTYTHCAYDPAEPTKLLVQFDDHHLPIGNLHFQIAYHFTVEDFPNNTEDEVFNATPITTEIDGETYQVMLDFTGETAPGIDFNMPSVGVTSVNGKIGAVTLNAEDVGAQPTIEDLATIRSGAAAGATAVQPDEMTAALATKQDTINDLTTIRSGAAAGATAYQKPGTGIPKTDLASGVQSSLDKADAAAPQANTYTKGEVDTLIAGAISDIDVDDALSTTSENPVQNKVLTTALNGKQDTISDLSTIRSGAAAGATAVQPAALTPIENDIDAIEGKIPSAASASNQLADKAFVNSALADKADTSDIPTALSQLSQDSTHRVVTDAEKSTWNGKQNSIDDLATIRSGAAAGATAYQKPGTGIPSTDLASAVQTSLERADEAAVRPYNTQSPDGMGYLVLDKEATFASQVTTANTIYEIRYDYDLNAQTFTMPAGCVLKFNGGSLRNGTLLLINSLINADGNVFFNTTLSGDIENNVIFAKWFNNVDNFIASANNLEGYSLLSFENKAYSPTISLNLRKKHYLEIDGDGCQFTWNKKEPFVSINTNVETDFVEALVLAEDASMGTNYIVVDDAGNLSAGDVLIIRDTRVNSFSPHRNYTNGEFVIVKSIDGNTVYLDKSLNGNYIVSDTNLGKTINFTNINLHDFIIKASVISDLSEATPAALLVNHSYGLIHNVQVNCNTSVQVRIGFCHDVTITDCVSIGRTRTSSFDVYNVFVGNSQNITTMRNSFTGGQHALAHGGNFSGLQYFGIPCRYISVIDNVISAQNDSLVFNAMGLDFHGCCEYVTIQNNTIDSIALSSINSVVAYNNVYGDKGISISESINLNITFVGNKINGGVTVNKASEANLTPQYYIPGNDILSFVNNIIKGRFSIGINKDYWDTSLQIVLDGNDFSDDTYKQNRIVANTKNVIIKNNHFDGFRMYFQSKNAYIFGNTFLVGSSITYYFGYFQSTNTQYFDIEELVISNNTIINNSVNASTFYTQSSVTINNLIICGNNIRSQISSGLFILFGQHDTAVCSKLVVSDNIVNSVIRMTYCYAGTLTNVGIVRNRENIKSSMSQVLSHLQNTPTIIAGEENFVTGTTSERPTMAANEAIGYCYFDTSLGKLIVWNGTGWVNIDGTSLSTPTYPHGGSTGSRPQASDVGIGYTYFDTGLNRIIVSNGTAWINIDGTALT